jgi:hypothetical protein
MKKLSGAQFVSLSENNGILWKSLFPVYKVMVYAVNCNDTMPNHSSIAQKYINKISSVIHRSSCKTKLIFCKFLEKDTTYHRREKLFTDTFGCLDIQFTENFVITHNKKMLKYTVIDVEENIGQFEKILFGLYNEKKCENFFLVQSTAGYEVNCIFLMKIFANSQQFEHSPFDLNLCKAAFIKKLITGKVNGIKFFFPFGSISFGSFETLEIEL